MSSLLVTNVVQDLLQTINFHDFNYYSEAGVLTIGYSACWLTITFSRSFKIINVAEYEVKEFSPCVIFALPVSAPHCEPEITWLNIGLDYKKESREFVDWSISLTL